MKNLLEREGQSKKVNHEKQAYEALLFTWEHEYDYYAARERPTSKNTTLNAVGFSAAVSAVFSRLFNQQNQ